MLETAILSYPHIDPVLLQLGPLKVRWYGLMYLVGFVAAMWLANRKAHAPGSTWSEKQVSDALFYGFLGVILGGRIGYTLFYQFDYFIQQPSYLFKIWDGGMSFHGGLIGVLIAMWATAKLQHRRFLQVGDFFAPMVPIGLGAGRLGNFINGELWGKPSDVPWAMVFPTGGPTPRHPSQLYEFLLEGVVLFLILQIFSRKNRPVGAISGLFLMCYGAFRFLVEFVREPDPQLGYLLGHLTMGQWLSMPMILLGLGLLIYAYRQQPKVNPSESGRSS